jgi:hypothetical protein
MGFRFASNMGIRIAGLIFTDLKKTYYKYMFFR